MPRRGGRTEQIHPTEALTEYSLALENKDRPEWAPEKREKMKQRFAQQGLRYHEVREKIVEWLRGNVPSGLIPNYLRFALAAYKLSEKGAVRGEALLQLAAIAEKNGINIDVARRMFEEVDPLRSVEIDWDALVAAIQAIRR